jgi:hypothetical protein
MRFGLTCLLVLYSLRASCEDSNVTTAAASESPPSFTALSSLNYKLEWNVEPNYWEGLVGKNAHSDAAGETFINFPSGLFPSNFDFASSAGHAASAVKEAKIERVLRKLEPGEGLRLGESDYVFSSPILEGLLPRPVPDDASLGEKILSLPIVRWFRPLPIPDPPGGGTYFKWGSRDKAWAGISQALPGPGTTDNVLYR